MAHGLLSTKCVFCVVLLLSATSGTPDEAGSDASVYGIRIETPDQSFVDGESSVYWNEPVNLRIFGDGLLNRANATTGSGSELRPLVVCFTSHSGQRGDDCGHMATTQLFHVDMSTASDTSALVTVNLPPLPATDTYRLCMKHLPDPAASDNTVPVEHWRHQGDEHWLRLHVHKRPTKKPMLPLWLQILLIVLLLGFSGLFSGLNLGLMSLDKTELKIVEKCGSEREKQYARTIAPIRKLSNFLLCTILLGNVLVNNTLTILLDDLSGNGIAAIAGATLAIVIFGEIIPQAICSRYGLAIGARTIWIVKVFMLITFPLSYPISKFLDCILGEELGNTYNRDRLRELLKVTQGEIDLIKDEVNIITGALELSKKMVKDIMTDIKNVYMIAQSAVLDFDTLSEIMRTGYTRIPVYEKEKTNITALLNIKDLAFIDPDDRTPLVTICKFYNHPINFVFEDTKLDVMLAEFKKGRFHMSFVRRVNNEGPGDPFYETTGVVTLEDIIEEIIQAEIMDETDTITDNRWRAPRSSQANKDFTVFNQPDDQNYPHMSPQLTLATFQFLSTSVPHFRPSIISETVLRKLLQQDVLRCVKPPTSSDVQCINPDLKMDTAHSDYVIYERGKRCDHFVLILQGRAQVTVGAESMVFEAGPFMYFGTQAFGGVTNRNADLESISDFGEQDSSSYMPDYEVRTSGPLEYLLIRRAHYISAVQATLLEGCSTAASQADCSVEERHLELQPPSVSSSPMSSSSPLIQGNEVVITVNELTDTRSKEGGEKTVKS